MNELSSPAVSVIIPVYNAEKYLDICLESVLKQSLENIEILVTDDGSTDRSWEIIEKYRVKYPEKIKVLKKSNEGLSKTRNQAISRAVGEYLVFLDSDDYLKDDYLEQLYRTAKEKDRDMVVCGQYKVSESGAILDRIFYPVNEEGQCVLRKLNIAGKLYKRSYIEKHQIRFPDGKVYEDNAFNLIALFLAKDIIFLEYCGYYQVVHGGSITTRKIQDDQLPYQEIEEAVSYVLRHKEELNDFSVFEFTLLSFMTYFIFVANKKNVYMEVQNRKSDSSIIEHLCVYSRALFQNYFPGYTKNEHIGIFKKNNLILKQKVGVRAFTLLCKTGLLKSFAKLYYLM